MMWRFVSCYWRTFAVLAATTYLMVLSKVVGW